MTELIGVCNLFGETSRLCYSVKELHIHVLPPAVVSDPHEPEKMTVDGVMRLLDDLQLHPESRLVLIIVWKFRAQTQCEFTRQEFCQGMYDLG